ncbi:hypothetical protein TVAG_062470 [Trichomonas vaginalis G3]|uniref:Uncharacterized protein n=1 Tax=Trichomonas vaginalis (strain ATCC PRA-98 / G3) TaxID=412133 RepID=A2DLK9_TRIV3|nr:spectrin binding [Trichomonas vaginalis G3]EAY18642.1 hypothetical protein TVAG_062470 [Trichomonas vaginalis G3]KAI5522527.1 spectrin binding [Trichomonas vaginalis G3]|eukprot:XP_001579628.1 hypothetical protein [Trichomonas vaginalis G3]
MNSQSAEALIKAIQADNDREFAKLCPSVFPLYSFPTQFYKPTEELLKDQPPLVSICVYYGAKKCLEYLSSKGADFTDTDDFGREPVHFLGYSPNIPSLIEFFSRKGINFNSVDNSDKNLLTKALEMTDSALLRLILQYKICSYKSDSQGHSPFYIAVQSGNLSSVQTLFELYYEQIRGEIMSSDDVINCAIKHKYTDIVVYLMNKQSGRDSKHHINTSIFLSNQDLLKYFITIGEDVNEPDETGYTPLVFAIQRDQIKMVDYLLDHGANPLIGGSEMPFKTAIDVSSVEVINRFITNLKDINALDQKGYSMLHYSADHTPYDEQIFMKLIQSGASLSTEATDGTTPAELLVRAGDSRAIAALIKNGTPMFSDGYSILHCAASFNNTEIMKMVIDTHKVDVKMPFGDQTPLMAAASANPEFSFPLESGDVPSVLDDISCLLDVDVFEEHFKAAIMLINYGADPTDPNVLQNAILSGDPLAVFFLLVMGANPAGLMNGRTLISEASERGLSVIAAILIFFGASDDEVEVHEEDIPLFQLFFSNNKILQICTKFSPPEILRYIVEKGEGIIDIDEEDDHGRRPVHQAILNGMITNLEILFEYEASRTPIDISHPNLIYSLAATQAISLVKTKTTQMRYEYLTRVVELLMERGEQIDAKDHNGKSPLQIAFECRNMRMVEVLMRHNADRNFSQSTQSFFQYVLSLTDFTSRDRLDFTRYINTDFDRQPDDDFEMNGTKIDISMMAHIVVLAIKLGEKIDSLLPNNETILHVFCRNNLISLVDYLVQKGANINAEDNNKQTPIHHIAITGDCDNIERLDNIQNVHYNEVDNFGRTPFSYACQHSKGPFLAFLVEHGASVNLVDYEGVPPINYAVIDGNFDSFRFLLRNEASPFASDKNRVAPIHIAAEKGLMEILYDLVRIPGQVKLRDSKGNTPLHYAVKYNQLNVIRLLTQDRTTIVEMNNDKETPLTMASNQSNADLVSYFFSLGAKFSPSQSFNALRGPLSRNEYEFARQMLEHGLHPYLKSGKNSLLTWAVLRKDINTIKWLITTAKVMQPVKDQDFTAFACAYVLEYDELCQFLMKIYLNNTNTAILGSFMPNLPQRIAEIRGRRSVEIHESLLKEVINFGQRYLPAELRKFIQVSHRYTMYQFLMAALEQIDIQSLLTENDRQKFEYAFSKISIQLFQLMLQKVDVNSIKKAIWEGSIDDMHNCLSGLDLSVTQKILGPQATDAIKNALNSNDVNVKKDVLTKLAVEMIRISYHRNKVEMMQAALEAGASPNIRNEEGFTLLHQAVLNGDAEMVKLLLKYGANQNKLNKSTMRMPIDDAVRLKNPEIVQILIAYGADMAHYDENGNTFIHEVIHTGQNELLKAILQWGVSTQIRNSENKTLLHTAIETQNVEACRILLDNYALTDVADNNGNTPGKLAMNSQNPDITMILFSRGQRA